MDEPLLIDSKTAAALLGISERKLWELRNRELIPYVRIGRAVRFAVTDLEGWIAERTQRGQHRA